MHNKKVIAQLEKVFPEVIGAVITIDSTEETVNLCPVNFQAVSTKYENPLTVCLGLGNQSHTLQNILATKQFVYAYPTAEQLKDIIYCGTVSGRTVDKLKNTTLQFTKSRTVAPLNLQAAVINFECTLRHTYVAGDFTLVLGEITHIHASDNEKAKKIYSLGGMKYGTVRVDEVLQENR